MTQKQIGLLLAFLAAGVEFAVAGGVAVNMHGYVRATHDLAVFLRPTEENARKAYAVLKEIGIPLNDKVPLDLLDDESNLRFGAVDEYVDLLSSIGEMRFDQVWRNRVETEVRGLQVPFISKQDLIENKRQVGRLRDLADVEELELLPEDELRNGFR